MDEKDEDFEKAMSAVRKDVAKPLGAALLVMILAVVVVWGIDRYEGGPALGPISDFLVVLAALHLLLFWMVRAGSRLGYWLYRLECAILGLLIPGAIGSSCRKTASRLKGREVRAAFEKKR